MTLIKIYPLIKKKHLLSIGRFFYLNVPLHALAYVLTPYTEILFSILVGPTSAWGGVRRKPHIDPEVQNGYMLVLDKLVPDRSVLKYEVIFLANTSVNMESLVTCIQPKI